MSPSDRTEHVTLLRTTIARIEAGVRPRDGRLVDGRPIDGRDSAEPGPRRAGRPLVPLGTEGLALDHMLGGGLRKGELHEVVPASPRDEGAASGFALALAARCLTGRDAAGREAAGRNAAGRDALSSTIQAGVLVWIVEDSASNESGAPYRPGLIAHGIDPDRLVVVRTRDARATLWATEEALRMRNFVVLAELWRGRHYGLVPSRRLVLAARAGGGIGLLLHAGLADRAGALSSGSATRFAVAAHPSPSVAGVDGRVPVPGRPVFAVRLDKARAAARDIDRDRTFPLLWNPEQRCFHDHDFPVAVASAPADRPAHAARPRRSG